ncbi:MAG TPA: hypothetical protein DEO62_05260 [Lachnospiraceae bacterium]|nr:hypothetical protein [Lachnospiraceae bacterium]
MHKVAQHCNGKLCNENDLLNKNEITGCIFVKIAQKYSLIFRYFAYCLFLTVVVILQYRATDCTKAQNLLQNVI